MWGSYSSVVGLVINVVVAIVVVGTLDDVEASIILWYGVLYTVQ